MVPPGKPFYGGRWHADVDKLDGCVGRRPDDILELTIHGETRSVLLLVGPLWQGRLQVVVFVPDCPVELQQAVDGVLARSPPRDLQAPLEPGLPAHVAAGHKGALAVDDQEFGVHDAEGQEEEALHQQLDVPGGQGLGPGQAQLVGPCRLGVDVPIGGGGVEELLEEGPRGEADVHPQRVGGSGGGGTVCLTLPGELS